MESFKSIMTCKSMLLLSILAINDSINVNTASLHSIRNDFIHSDISGTGWRHDDVITKFIISMFCVLYLNKLLQLDWLSALTVWDWLWVNTVDANIYFRKDYIWHPLTPTDLPRYISIEFSIEHVKDDFFTRDHFELITC